jgi:hypothetical protein
MTVVSNRRMRRMILSLCFLLFAVCLCAQSSPADKREKAVIQRAKNLLVSSLDNSLPKVTLEFFLQYEAGDAPIRWEVNDCGEETGNPTMDRGRDFPMCVEADFDVNHQAVSVLVSVGTFKKGTSGVPILFSLTITGVSGVVRTLHHLGDLPMELHRPLPKLPQDSPGPARACLSRPNGKISRGNQSDPL